MWRIQRPIYHSEPLQPRTRPRTCPATIASPPVRLCEQCDNNRPLLLTFIGHRGNIMKQAPPWSKELFTVTNRRGGDDNMPQYKLDDGDTWVLHNELQRVYGGIVLQPPPDVFDPPDYKIVKTLPDRVYYSGFHWLKKHRLFCRQHRLCSNRPPHHRNCRRLSNNRCRRPLCNNHYRPSGYANRHGCTTRRRGTG